jgi:phosphoribosylformylglycinamidine cyclo-ligase
MADQYFEKVITPGDRASRLAKKICFQSHQNCPAVRVVPHQPRNFRGPVGYVWQRWILDQMASYEADATGRITSWKMLEEVENDGAGGKPQFFSLVGTPRVFEGLGWEIITMNADDFARSGRFPAIMANEINVKKITEKNFPLFEAAMRGYGKALRAAGIINITGETAIMAHSITAFCDIDSDEQLVLTWGGTCIGLASKDLLIDGSKIKPGMPIVGFREFGYRCNGGTLLTNLIRAKWGPNPRRIMQNSEAMTFVSALTVPSKSYARTVTRLMGWGPYGSPSLRRHRIYGIAHITGGGVWGKLADVLPRGVGARLHSMPEPPEVLLKAQELSMDTQYKLTDWQAYGTLHGGCGMLLVCDRDDVDTILHEARNDGIHAHIVGETFKSQKREIIIDSKFQEGKKLSSLRPE